MKIAIAVDHAAYLFKNDLIIFLEILGHIIIDCGCNSEENCDYPDYGSLALKVLIEGKADRVILCCGNGIGMSILANKTKGVIAALVYSESSAAATRHHHNSNTLCLGIREFSVQELLKFTKIWLESDFKAGRHLRRINLVKELEK